MEAEDETRIVGRGDKISSPGSRQGLTEAVGGVGTSRPVPLDLVAARAMVGRYQPIQRLGHGGMATVYLGRAVGTAGFERLVAIKVIHPHLASEPEFVEMFLDEARIAARIHHPNVVEIIDLGQDNDLFYMVMEYVEGDTLASVLRQLRRHDTQLAVPAVLQIVIDACQGLAAAHDLCDRDGRPLGLVHRDVSPHNLLVTTDGRVKVVDFGIMKAAGKRSTTLTGQLRGKIAYMSPEQARGQRVDRRADLFAIGTVLWELLSGERLFAAETEAETLARVNLCEIPDIATRRPDVPESLRTLLSKCLASDPDRRYARAQDLLRDARAALRELEVDEPRELLAAVVRHHCGGRIEYLRAASRTATLEDRELLPRVVVPAANDVERSSGMLARVSDMAASEGSMLTPVPARGSTWTQRLALPLLGVAVGTIATAYWDRPAPPAPAAIAPPRVDPPARAPAVVKWQFNTKPQGAEVVVGERVLEGRTPIGEELPIGEEPIHVTLRLEGYEPYDLDLVPLASQNYSIVLVPIASEPATQAASPPVKIWRRRPPVRAGEGVRRRVSPPKSSDSPTSPASEGHDEQGTEDRRTPYQMPNFRLAESVSTQGDRAPR